MKKIPKYPKSKIPKKTNTTNESRIRNSPGFTLVEVLVAISILSIGILAVSQMTVMGMKVSTTVNQRMYARVVMATVFENLNTLPSAHAWLFDTDHAAVLTYEPDSLLNDHYWRVTDPNAPYSYMTWWRVADNVPEIGMKTIRIWVVWGQTMNHKISTDLIKRM
ncbi:MAG: prepilin-type N-terminal cleavage/methylation domain-containing protein [bacterium]